MGIESRLTLIQGPPGTVKTSTLAGLAANWLNMYPRERIMICAPSNSVIDHISNELQKIPSLA